MKIRNVMQLLFILLALLMAACQMPIGNESSNETSPQRFVALTPEESVEYMNFLGESFDLLDQTKKAQLFEAGTCKVNRAKFRIEDDSSHHEITTLSELHDFQSKSVDVNATFSGWGLKLSAGVNVNIAESANKMSNTVLIIDEQSISLEQAQLDLPLNFGDDYYQEIEANKSLFADKYGDVYAAYVELGGSLKVVYKATIDSSSKFTKSQVKVAVAAKYKKSFEAGVEVDVSDEHKEVLASCNIELTVFTSGGYKMNKRIDNVSDILIFRQEFIDYYNTEDPILSPLKIEYRKYSSEHQRNIEEDVINKREYEKLINILETYLDYSYLKIETRIEIGEKIDLLYTESKGSGLERPSANELVFINALIETDRISSGGIDESSNENEVFVEFPADGQWHSIVENQSGRQTYIVDASFGKPGCHSRGRWTAINTYGQVYVDGGASKYGPYIIELRWTGSIYNMALQIRTSGDVGGNSMIRILYNTIILN